LRDISSHIHTSAFTDIPYSTKTKIIKLLSWDIQDLQPFVFFLRHLAHTGININDICLAKLSTITDLNVCEWIIGGYTTRDNALQYLPLSHLHGRVSINVLEFIATITTILLSITADTHSTTRPYIFTFTDNISAAGWPFHARFIPVKDNCHDDIARLLTHLLLQHKATLHPEHIPSKDNDITDSLSKEFHLNDNDFLTLLTPQLIHTHIQGLHTFIISSIPTTLISRITSTVGSRPSTKALPHHPSLRSLT
jgi:hypothetical protein